jgi:hypothetical protein
LTGRSLMLLHGTQPRELIPSPRRAGQQAESDDRRG